MFLKLVVNENIAKLHKVWVTENFNICIIKFSICAETVGITTASQIRFHQRHGFIENADSCRDFKQNNTNGKLQYWKITFNLMITSKIIYYIFDQLRWSIYDSHKVHSLSGNFLFWDWENFYIILLWFSFLNSQIAIIH